MEELRGTLFRLLKDELDSLSIGHPYNKSRILRMKDICHLLTYDKYVDMTDDDIFIYGIVSLIEEASEESMEHLK